MIIQSTDAIFQELLAYKETQLPLSGLDTTITSETDLRIELLTDSKVAEWVLQLYNTAYHSRNVQTGMQSAIDEIIVELKKQRVPDPMWFIDKVKAFQYGDTIVIIDGIPGYATIDTAKQILESVTTSIRENSIYIKIRRVNDTLLSVPEVTALQGYISRIQYAGARIILENYEPDLIAIIMTVIYDGSKDLATVKANVETTINDYLANIEFDSEIIVNKLIDKLQQVDGVIDPRIDEMSAINTLGNPTIIKHNYPTYAGYAKINPDKSFDTDVTYNGEVRKYIKYTPKEYE